MCWFGGKCKRCLGYCGAGASGWSRACFVYAPNRACLVRKSTRLVQSAFCLSLSKGMTAPSFSINQHNQRDSSTPLPQHNAHHTGVLSSACCVRALD